MPELKPSNSAPAERPPPSTPSTPQISRARTQRSTTSHPPLEHAFSFQHLDDVSNYYADRHDYAQSDSESEDTDDLEKVRREDEEEAAERGEEEVAEVRMGVRDTHDLEANLEKTKSTKSRRSSKSAKDPNLVCLLRVIVKEIGTDG